MRIFLRAICMTLGLGLLVQTAQANEEIKSMLTNMFSTMANQAMQEMMNERARRAANQGLQNRSLRASSTGWCQVWRNGVKDVEKQCQVTQSCKTSGSCSQSFHWSTGGTTIVEYWQNQPRRINGYPTKLVSLNGQACVKDVPPGEVFCYVGLQDTTPTSSQASTEPMVTLPDQAHEVSQEQGDSEPSNFSNTGNDDGFTAALSAYLQSVANTSAEPAVVAERCERGAVLVNDYIDKLDDGLLDTLSSQFERDNCTG